MRQARLKITKVLAQTSLSACVKDVRVTYLMWCVTRMPVSTSGWSEKRRKIISKGVRWSEQLCYAQSCTPSLSYILLWGGFLDSVTCCTWVVMVEGGGHYARQSCSHADDAGYAFIQPACALWARENMAVPAAAMINATWELHGFLENETVDSWCMV